MFLLLLVGICSSPAKLANETSEYVDLIELNHFYGHDGKHVYDQVILWELDPVTRKFRVRDWRLADGSYPLAENGLCQVRLIDMQSTWNVRSKLFRESWTQIDPERMDKWNHPESERVTLARRMEACK